MAKYRIMTFDGGGTLGALSLQLLNRLTEENPALISRTHVFAGNSIGSFTALALASGRSPKETLQYFEAEILPAFRLPGREDLFSINNYHIPVLLKRYETFSRQAFALKI